MRDLKLRKQGLLGVENDPSKNLIERNKSFSFRWKEVFAKQLKESYERR